MSKDRQITETEFGVIESAACTSYVLIRSAIAKLEEPGVDTLHPRIEETRAMLIAVRRKVDAITKIMSGGRAESMKQSHTVELEP